MKVLFYIFCWPFILVWKIFALALKFAKTLLCFEAAKAIGAVIFFVALIPVWLFCPGIIIGCLIFVPVVSIIVGIVSEIATWF